jgi:hypothetical protein
MLRYRTIILAVCATLVFCIVAQKILLLLLPYAMKRVGGEMFKRFLKTFKIVSDYVKLATGFLSTIN